MKMRSGKYQIVNVCNDTSDPKFGTSNGQAVIYQTSDRQKAIDLYEECRAGVLFGSMVFALISPTGDLLAAG